MSMTPQESLEIENAINLASGMIGTSFALIGVPGMGMALSAGGNLLFDAYAPGETPQALYYKALAKEIEQVAEALMKRLNEISQQIQGLQTDLVDLSNAIKKLGVDIDLTAYNNASSTINQYYSEFADYTVQASSTHEQEQKAAATGLWELLSDPVNGPTSDVAIAMRNLFSTVTDDLDDTPGLISRQADLVSMAVQGWVADRSNYRKGNIDWRGFSKTYQGVDNSMIFESAYGTAAQAAIQQFVLPTLSTILTVQYRGIQFLVNAYANSALANEMKTFQGYSQDIVKTISTLDKTLSSADQVDSAIAEGLKATPIQISDPFSAMFGVGEGDLRQIKGYTTWKPGFSRAPVIGLEGADQPTWSFVDLKGDLTLGKNYPSIKCWDDNPDKEPFFQFAFAQHGHIEVPKPSSKIPTPLSADLEYVTQTLTKEANAPNGPQIKITQVPTSAKPSIQGTVSKLPSDTAATIVVFSATSKTWTQAADGVAIGSDGSFQADVKVATPLLWAVAVVKQGWTWAGANKQQPPKIDNPDLLAIVAVPAPKSGASSS